MEPKFENKKLTIREEMEKDAKWEKNQKIIDMAVVSSLFSDLKKDQVIQKANQKNMWDTILSHYTQIKYLQHLISDLGLKIVDLQQINKKLNERTKYLKKEIDKINNEKEKK